MINPIILAGGAGTRLWPVSRKTMPKQFATLMDDCSLFEATLSRLCGEGFERPTIVTGSDYRFICVEQLAKAGIDDAEFLVEPEGRNTAPAILTAALQFEDTPDAILLVCPSDHRVTDIDAFHEALQIGLRAATMGRIVTFGVHPDRPETGYGYLELESEVEEDLTTALPLKSFCEKPNSVTAAQMLATGRYLWNAGIFMFQAGTIIEAFRNHAPHLVMPCQAALNNSRRQLGFRMLDEKAYSRAQNISIDYAVMERCETIDVVPFDGGWSDLGSWQSIHAQSTCDDDGNAVSETSNAIECRGSLLRSHSPDIEVIGIGLDNIAVVATDDAVLVLNMEHGDRMRDAVGILQGKGARQATEFKQNHRPWGYYETLSLGSRFQVKRIIVKPGGTLSLQSHMHRAEHWTVVEGSARVTVDNSVDLLAENQSVYIPLGAVHRLENPGKVPLVLIEVQSGTYLGEDDIVRYEDIYARAEAA